MLPARDRHRDRAGWIVEALVADGRRPVRQRAVAVHAGDHPRAAVVEGGVGQRDPAGEVGLGLDVGVAVVLVPGERRSAPSGFLYTAWSQ